MTFTIFYKNKCPFCERAEDQFKLYNLSYKKYVVNEDFSPTEFKEQFGENATYPQVFYNKQHVGGCDDTLHFIKQKFQ